MKDEVIFRRRQRLKYHFVHTSKVLLYGYKKLSDAAKITYQVIDGFDWEDKETGDSKGYAFPATETLASIRETSARTIRRHLYELEQAGLLTRVRRRYQASILYIENVSTLETDRYIETYIDQKSGGKDSTSSRTPKTSTERIPKPTQESRTDKNVRSRQASETTKMSVLDEANLNLPKEEEVNKKNVNVVENRSNKTQSMQQILGKYEPPTVTQESRGGKSKKSDRKSKRDYVAQTLADEFQDPEGMGCYRRIADKLPEAVIFRLMAEVKETARAGKVRTKPAAVFVSAAKEYAEDHGIKLRFGSDRSRSP